MCVCVCVSSHLCSSSRFSLRNRIFLYGLLSSLEMIVGDLYVQLANIIMAMVFAVIHLYFPLFKSVRMADDTNMF